MPYFTNHEDLNIFYKEINSSNSKFPLVFLHGYGSSLIMFARQIPFLQDYFRIILLDAQGHGRSEKLTESLQEDLCTKTIRDLEQLLEILNIETSLGVIAHSLFGTSVAIKFTERFPKLVEFLVLLNPGHLILDSTIKNVFWNLLPQFTRMHFNEIALYSLDPLLERTIPFIKGVIASDNDESAQIKSFNIEDHEIQQRIDEMINNPLQPSRILCPTLIIGAELDNFAPVFMAKYLDSYISNSELYVVPMTGHFGLEQRYDKYNKIIFKFLKTNKFVRNDKR